MILVRIEFESIYNNLKSIQDNLRDSTEFFLYLTEFNGIIFC